MLVMLWLNSFSLEIRLAIIAFIGLIAGAFANYLIYSWAYFPRHISPWAPPEPTAPSRTITDRLPVLGWFGLRREHGLHGTGFWVRPLLIELAMALCLPALYWFDTQTAGLLPPSLRYPHAISAFSSWGHTLFVFHSVIFTLMVAATFIDFDEQTIPDIITLPGTLFSLLVATLPWRSWLPADVYWDNQSGITEATFNVPWPFDAGWLERSGLWLALAIWSVWCFALTDRHLVLRNGLLRAVGYLCHGIRRNPTSRALGVMWIVGLVAVVGVWIQSGDAFHGLLTSLIGLAVGGGAVWAVRLVAGLAMGQEAMGFGDVTLMAMLGAALGWQCAMLSCFFAPMLAICVVLIQFLVTRQPAVPFGPYLCGGTVLTVLGWDLFWNRTFSQYVLLGEVLVWILVVALVAMGAMLAIWQQIKRLLFAH
jgi:leader peptidase (prepilin peptidase) / N-methyltransferase